MCRCNRDMCMFTSPHLPGDTPLVILGLYWIRPKLIGLPLYILGFNGLLKRLSMMVLIVFANHHKYLEKIMDYLSF